MCSLRQDQVEYLQNCSNILSNHCFDDVDEKNSFVDGVLVELLRNLRENKLYFSHKSVTQTLEQIISSGLSSSQESSIFVALAGLWGILSERPVASFALEALVRHCSERNNIIAVAKEVIINEPKLNLAWTRCGSYILRAILQKMRSMFKDETNVSDENISITDSWFKCVEVVLARLSAKRSMWQNRYSGPLLCVFIELQTSPKPTQTMSRILLEHISTGGLPPLIELATHPISSHIVELLLQRHYLTFLTAFSDHGRVTLENGSENSSIQTKDMSDDNVIIKSMQRGMLARLALNDAGMRVLAAIIRGAPTERVVKRLWRAGISPHVSSMLANRNFAPILELFRRRDFLLNIYRVIGLLNDVDEKTISDLQEERSRQESDTKLISNEDHPTGDLQRLHNSVAPESIKIGVSGSSGSWFGPLHKLLTSSIFHGKKGQSFGVQFVQAIIDNLSEKCRECDSNATYEELVTLITNDFNHVPSEVLRHLALQADGSRLLQTYLAFLRNISSLPQREASSIPRNEMIERFIRRFRSMLPTLAQDTYGSHFLESVLNHYSMKRPKWVDHQLLTAKVIQALRQSKSGRIMIQKYNLETEQRNRLRKRERPLSATTGKNKRNI